MRSNGIGRWIKCGVAAVVAVGVSLLLFVAIALVNRVDPVAPRTLPPEKLAILQARLEPPPPPPGPKPPRPKPPRPKPEAPTVQINLDLPMPDPQPMELPPVPLKLLPPSLPSPSAVVMQPVAAAVPPATTPPAASPPPPAASPPPPAPRTSPSPRHANSIDQPPRGISVRDPAYPAKALRRGQEGSVTVEVLIDENGRVSSVRVVAAEGSDVFVDAVQRVAADWRFTPPRHRGQPVKVLATKTVQFKLED